MQSMCFSDCFTIASNRIVGTAGGVTTTYIGNYFEKDGETQVFRLSNWQSQLPGCTSTMKKYYYVGSVRVAVKAGTTLSYLLGDHGVCACANTGSTSITTNNAGTKTAELRYRAVANNALRYSLKKSRKAGFPGVKRATQTAPHRPPSTLQGSANRARSGCTFTGHAGMTVILTAGPVQIQMYQKVKGFKGLIVTPTRTTTRSATRIPQAIPFGIPSVSLRPDSCMSLLVRPPGIPHTLKMCFRSTRLNRMRCWLVGLQRISRPLR
jgi:hypothetical protein